MGKRNIRIRRHELANRLGELKNQEAHVILLDGRTFFGKVTETAPQSLTIVDVNARWTSLKRHTHQLALADIMEVIFDQVTEY